MVKCADLQGVAKGCEQTSFVEAVRHFDPFDFAQDRVEKSRNGLLRDFSTRPCWALVEMTGLGCA